jgi:alanyl-tRNA synthetase
MKMTSTEIRQAFLDFFQKRAHKIVSSSSLLTSDPTVLLTTAGMQQFKEYYLGEPSPYGNRVATSQKCFRTSDIDEVGDNFHLTFLEMLGNFSFGDYFKKEAIELAWKFLVGPPLRLDPDRFWTTVFKGEEGIPRDEESLKIWNEWLGIDRDKIYEFGKEENFWGPTGLEGPCGPTTEIHFDLTQKPCFKKEKCIPNCACGRFVEIWNLVFNEYYQDKKRSLAPLKEKGVDTGLGLERLAMVIQRKPSVFEIDLSEPLIREISQISSKPYNLNPKPYRIIADHIKGSVFLASEGILPSNVEQGYVLRRVLRRAIRFGKLLDLPKNFLIPLAQKIIEIYQDTYPEVKSRETDILTIIQAEEEKFEKTLERGLKQFEKISAQGDIEGKDAFHLFDTFGFPLELTQELAKEKGLKIDIKGFEESFARHREISRAGAEKKFGGVGKKATYQAAKLHTATHLLHQALREVLGNHVKQMGSDITPQRLRFDFAHPSKMTTNQIKKVANLVNQKIKEDLEVKKEEMPYQKAIATGALAFFKEKYPEIVTVYSVGDPSDPSGQAFSKEICAGPHVKKTSELGKFKIIKEESAGANSRRIRAVLGE